MRNLFVLFIFAFALTANALILKTGSGNEFDYTGTSVKAGGYDNVYTTVKNISGATQTSGTIMVHDLTKDDGASVTTTTTAFISPACVLVEDVVDDGFGKCLIRGYISDLKFDASTTASAGYPIYLSRSNAGYAVTADHSNDKIDGWVKIGHILDAAATSADVEAYINLK